MRTIAFAALLGWSVAAAWPGAARADEDPHAEMAAALAAQADLQPIALVLPVASAAPRHASAASAVKRGTGPRPAGDVARTAASAAAAADAANRVSQHAQAQAAAQALAHQAQAAAAAAAGQAQSQAAKERASHPHPR